MSALGISESLSQYRVVIGHTGLLRTLLRQFKLDKRAERFLLAQRAALKTHGREHVLQRIEKFISSRTIVEEADNITLFELSHHKQNVGQRTQQEILHRLLEKRKRSSEYSQIIEALDFLAAWSELSLTPDNFQERIQPYINDTAADALLTEWKATVDLLRAYGLPAEQITIQPELERDWDYYTGIVFELRYDNRVIAAGGRYDGLVQLLDDDPATNRLVPAVGFAYYIDQLINVLPKSGTQHKPVISIAGENLAAAIWSEKLRKAGVSIQLVLQDEALYALSANTVRYREKIYSTDELSTLIEVLGNQ
jgi:histidyl-tRNA synthetase